MLKSIEGVIRAAVLDGYNSRAVQLREFAKFNLVYGWNASGKTTLSRVIGLLEGAGPSRLPAGAYARFAVEGGTLDTRIYKALPWLQALVRRLGKSAERAIRKNETDIGPAVNAGGGSQRAAPVLEAN